jgi:indolepyruvate decarboxylase
VRTEDELDAALEKARTSSEGPALIEIMLDKLDTSEGLKRLGAALSPDRPRQ